MTTTFPGSIDALPRPTPLSPMNIDPYRGSYVIDNISDAIEAVEAKLGIGASLAGVSGVLRATGTGLSTWGSAQASDISAGVIGTSHLVANAVTQGGVATGSSADPTTSSSSYSVLQGNGVSDGAGTGMRIDLTTTTGSKVLVMLFCAVTNDTAGKYVSIGVSLDNTVTPQADARATIRTANDVSTLSVFHLMSPVAGAHSFRGLWASESGNAKAFGFARALVAIELKR